MRRGLGSDVAGSRPYQPGDDVDKIDWYASARISLARGSEEFVVREHFADEAPRVVVLSDRRPSMSVFAEGWPWLNKPEAIRHAVTLIGSSATAARGLLGYFDEAEGDAYWHPPRSSHAYGAPELDRSFGAPEDTVQRGLRHLAEHKRDLPAGTFVFVVSDFLVAPTRDEWLDALERRFEIVPVIVQDPMWEQSFPDVSGVVVPFVSPDGSGVSSRRSQRARPESSATRTSSAGRACCTAFAHSTWIRWSSTRTSRVTSCLRSSAGRISACSRGGEHEVPRRPGRRACARRVRWK